MVIIHNYSLPQLVETEKKICFIDKEMLKDYDVISLKRVSRENKNKDRNKGLIFLEDLKPVSQNKK